MWYAIEDKFKGNICNFSTQGWENLKGYADGKGFIQMGNYCSSVPMMYQLLTGTDKGYDCFRSVIMSDCSDIGYPLLDHAFCLRDANDNLEIISNTYLSKEEVLDYAKGLKSLYPLMNVKVLKNSFYSGGTTSVAFSLKPSI